MTNAVVDNNETKILDAAEVMIRSRGYNGFSFREIAEEVGIKSSTVHYYFPTKGALGVAVAERYTNEFLSALGSPHEASNDANTVIEHIRGVARKSYFEKRLMCLCGMLGAEIASLPSQVTEQTRSFFAQSTEWLVQALGHTDWGKGKDQPTLRKMSLKVLAILEGALIIARTMNDPKIFDEIEIETLKSP